MTEINIGDVGIFLAAPLNGGNKTEVYIKTVKGDTLVLTLPYQFNHFISRLYLCLEEGVSFHNSFPFMRERQRNLILFGTSQIQPGRKK